jgi:hypothetical protein
VAIAPTDLVGFKPATRALLLCHDRPGASTPAMM